MNLLSCDATTLLSYLKTEPQRARDLRAYIGWSSTRFDRTVTDLTEANPPLVERMFDYDDEEFIRRALVGQSFQGFGDFDDCA